MPRNIKQKILNIFSPQRMSGFVVERLSCKQLSGWIILEDDRDPVPQNFQVIEKGAVVSLNVSLFHRPVFAKQKKDNLFGFRIQFSHDLSCLSDGIFFYLDGQNFKEPSFLSKVNGEFSSPSRSVYFLNRMVLQAMLNRETLPSAKTLEHLLQPEHATSKSPDSGMTDLVSRELSECLIQTGLRSKCGVAIVGKSGHLFLHGGANNVDDLFKNAQIHTEKTPYWLSLFEERQRKATESGYRYIQLVIPEKQSLLGDKYYRHISGPSHLLNDIEKSEVRGYFSVLKAVSRYSNKDLFFKTDSHLCAKGTYLLFRKLMAQLGNNIDEEPKFDIAQTIMGDLGIKYSPITFWEEVKVTAGVIKGNRKIKYKFIPENKAHMGSQIYWTNSCALFKEKVLIFGNSFSDLGTQQHHLTWWFSHYFVECQFVWSAEFNENLIEKFNPDIVIGQSIERFLRLVPKL